MKSEKKGSLVLGLVILLGLLFLTGITTYYVTKAHIKPETLVVEHNNTIIVNHTIIQKIPEYHNVTVIKYLPKNITLEDCQGFVDEALNESNCTLINHTNIRNFITDADCSTYCVNGHKVDVMVGDVKVVNGTNYTYEAFNNYSDCLGYCGVGSDACSCWVAQE